MNGRIVLVRLAHRNYGFVRFLSFPVGARQADLQQLVHRVFPLLQHSLRGAPVAVMPAELFRMHVHLAQLRGELVILLRLELLLADLAVQAEEHLGDLVAVLVAELESLVRRFGREDAHQRGRGFVRLFGVIVKEIGSVVAAGIRRRLFRGSGLRNGGGIRYSGAILRRKRQSRGEKGKK